MTGLLAQDRWAYSALPDRPSGRWPNGAGLALYVAVGIEDYSFGQGATEDILPGVPQPDLVNTAWRDYGNRVGAFRLLDRLGSFGIRPAALLNTAIYDQAPALARALRAAGAEIVAHGQANSDSLAGMKEACERDYIADTAARIAQEEGVAPGGWSSPWLTHTPRTLDLLAEAGFGYLLDLRLDDQPVWLRTRAGRLLSIPYSAEINDSTTSVGRMASGRAFADMVVDEFDELLDASRHRPVVMSVIVHSFISGQPFRLRAISRALAHLASHGDRVWFAQPNEIAAAVARDPCLAV